MNSYQTYKYSGMEWFGKIPSHWSLLPIKYLFTERNEKNIHWDKHYLSIVKNKGVVLYSEKGNVGNKTSERPENYKMVYMYDIVINPMNIIIGSVGKSKQSGCLSSVYIVLKPNNIIDCSYYHYIFSVKKFQMSLKRISYGIMEIRESLNKIEFFAEKLPFPPLDEQKQISSFLDHKTKLIDDLIEKTKKKIELLKEKRISLINHCVTKGLNPNVEMKDSGVEWIGEIPVHWSLRRGSTIGQYSKGSGISKDEVRDSGIPCIRYGEIYTIYNRIVFSPISFILEKNNDSRVKASKGSILLTGSGETIEDIGKSIVYMGEPDIYIGGDIIIINLKNEILPLFMSYLMNSECIRFQKSMFGKGEIIVHIYPKNIREILFCIPPLSEQQQIVEYLDEQTQKMDALIEKESRRIELLKEYRQSLISEVITGKIDIRDKVAV